jgi:hypothetical protein
MYDYDRRKTAGKTWYHTTSWQATEGIMETGLSGRNRGGYTTAYGEAAISEYYANKRPAFISAKPYPKHGDLDTILEVDVSGVPLAADIPTLVEDHTGTSYGRVVLYHTDDSGKPLLGPKAWAASKTAIRALEPVAKWDRREKVMEVSMDGLRKPGSPEAKAAIRLTGTAVFYVTIPPEKIKVQGGKLTKAEKRRWEEKQDIALYGEPVPTLGDMDGLSDEEFMEQVRYWREKKRRR